MRMLFLDYDARREPKTTRFCVRCQRDIRPQQLVRVVRVLDAYVLHPEDAGNLGNDFLLGLECAKRFPLSYSRPETIPNLKG